LPRTVVNRIRHEFREKQKATSLFALLEDIEAVALLEKEIRLHQEEIEILSRSQQFRRYLKRLQTKERAAAVEAAVWLLRGDYPLPSVFASKYGIKKSRMSRILTNIKSIMHELGVDVVSWRGRS
jgi:transcriptional regulator of met regulon